jgi:hypothetical protein
LISGFRLFYNDAENVPFFGSEFFIRLKPGPLMEFWDQRILAFISGLKTRTADGNADGKPDGKRTADGR